jgi:ribonuclease P protein component
MTLPRRLRLSRAAFGAALGARGRAASEHFSITKGPTLEGGAAVVISKKVAKRSVDRHLLKRRVLTILRPHISPRHSLVVYARAGAPALSFRTLKEELEILLSRV